MVIVRRSYGRESGSHLVWNSVGNCPLGVAGETVFAFTLTTNAPGRGKWNGRVTDLTMNEYRSMKPLGLQSFSGMGKLGPVKKRRR